jgi:hypothetical protein
VAHRLAFSGKLLKEDVAEVRIYDSFVRGTHKILGEALKDPQVTIFDIGWDICQTDIPDVARKRWMGSLTLRRYGCCNVTSFPDRPST